MLDQNRTRFEPKAELATLTSALFLPGELIEIRLIETWSTQGKKESCLVDRLWLRACEIPNHFERLRRQNEAGANVFFGVNPRKEAQGTKESVALCRTLWCDWDGIESVKALDRCEKLGFPPPSILLASGHGVHGYWLLNEPAKVESVVDRERFELRLQQLCRSLGADMTQDISRLMRLPGFLNVKDFRNGGRAVPCRLIHCDPSTRYALTTSERWDLKRDIPPFPPAIRLSDASMNKPHIAARIRGLVTYLDKEVADRSGRDFGVVMGLLRLGLSVDEVRGLVRGKSKFAEGEGGEAYLNRTLMRAISAI